MVADVDSSLEFGFVLGVLGPTPEPRHVTAPLLAAGRALVGFQCPNTAGAAVYRA